MQPSPSLLERHNSGSQAVQRRKSPPPTFINLDDCKPLISTTTTNTSTNSSNHGTTAFVFTSSRTLRALQDQEDRRRSPGSPVASSPATPPTPSSTSSYGSRHRAQLTLSQLTKHSEGAIDARSLIGPKMRAAGFVNLPHTLGSRSDLSSPGTPCSPYMTSPVSAHFPRMPNDPPNFPPIVFINPFAATTISMWDCQRNALRSSSRPGRSSHSDSGTAANEDTPGPALASSDFFAPSSASRPPRRMPMRESSGSSSSESSGLLSSSGSSSTLFSSASSPSSGLTSVEETDEESRESDAKGKAKAKVVEPSEYPFPPAYDHSHSPKSAKSGSRASSATASPTSYAGPVAAASSSSVRLPTCPLTISHRQDARTRPLTPPRQQRSSRDRTDGARARGKPSVAPTPTFATAKRPQAQRQYSLTELCDSSPFIWLTKSDMFAPPAPIPRSPIRASSATPSLLPASMSRPRLPPEAPPHRRHLTAPDNLPTLASTRERHHRIPSAPIRLTANPSERGSASSDQESKKTKATRAGRTHDQANEESSRADADGAVAHRSGGGPATLSSTHAAQASAGSGPEPRGRGRDTRGKLLGASETMEERATAEETDLELEKARQGLAAMVLARRERDREYARHVAADRERDKLVKQKQRAHHKLRAKVVPDDDPSESETTMVDQAHSPTVAKSID
ncbi:hypothetical protein C8Q77DRAFT_386897 [Trametes polyzona]|nr:hypothetical protein C8Q77DRAFT_386897 [Trametes polyzona]